MIQGKVNFISARLPCPLLLLAAGLNYYYVAQVSSSADEAKITITGTGTYLADGPVTVAARALRPSARLRRVIDASLARRSLRLRPRSR